MNLNSQILNGSFTNGTSNWITQSNFYCTTSSSFTNYRTSPGYAWFASSDGQIANSNNIWGTLTQSFIMSTVYSSASIDFYTKIQTDEVVATAYDKMTCTITDASTNLTSQIILSNVDASSSYILRSIPIPTSMAGHTLTLTFYAENDKAKGTCFRIDDVSLMVTTGCTQPSVPTGLTATTVSSSEIDLSWNAATNAAGYDVYNCDDNSYIGYTSNTNYQHTGLIAGSKHSYNISAQNTQSCISSKTSCVNATTLNNSVSILTIKPSKLSYSPTENVVFTGSLLTSTGQPVPNVNIEIDDPLQQQCLIGPFTTDSNGKFSWSSSNKFGFTGICAYTFHGPSSDVYCILSIYPTEGLSLASKTMSINLGVTSNMSDVNLALTKKLGTLPATSDVTLLSEFGKLLNDVGATIVDSYDNFISNPVNKTAALTAVACTGGTAWSGVGVTACLPLYKFVAVAAINSVINTGMNDLIDNSDLSVDQKTIYKEIVKPGYDCVKGIIKLNPKDAVSDALDIGSSTWSCGTAVSNIFKKNDKTVLTIKAPASSSSTSKDAMGIYIITNDAPINDNPCDAGVITLPVGTSCSFTQGTNVGATNSSIPNASCDGTSNGDVWFKFTVPSSGHVVINTNAGTIDDMGMALYTGSNCNSLTYYNCYPNGSTYSKYMPYADVTGLTPNTTMWIRLWDYNNNNFGTFSICVTGSPTEVDDISASDKIKINPNPTTGKFEIIGMELLGSNCKIEIFNHVGKSIYVSKNENFGNKISLDLNSYPVGMYIVKLSNNGVSYQKKVSKK